VDDETARLLREAARWAPSAMDRQPWRLLVGHRSGPTHTPLVDALAPGNRVWAADAGAVREARESAPRVRLPIDEIAYATGWGRPCRDTDAVE
jgi:hypothetical protein